MKNTISCLVKVLCVITILACLSPAQAAEKESPQKSPVDAAMNLHHMHTMMNHGLIMALQGADLVMLSEMKMAPGVDEITLSHGRSMIADGKSMLKDMLSGEHMKEIAFIRRSEHHPYDLYP